MEEIHTKLQNVVISEVNSNHIIDNSHSVKKSKKENCETDHENQENGMPLNLNGLSSPTKNTSHQTSSDNEASTELSELAPKIPIQTQCPSVQDLETIEMIRDNETFQITYKVYESELELPSIMKLIQKDLSEPYSIYTYRYFIHNWPKLCYLALYENKCVGCIVCKLDVHRQMIKRGYIAMLAVDKDYRKLKIGTTLVQKAIRVMIANQADEVVLETEITNQPALKLYENLGFVRDKRLFHYYLNGVDALRLKVRLPERR
jgi:N-alpha-acetyltransferase 30